MWYRYRQLQGAKAARQPRQPVGGHNIMWSCWLRRSQSEPAARSREQQAVSSQQPVWVVKMETQINIERGVVNDVVVFVAMEP